jgi:peroxiredoxin
VFAYPRTGAPGESVPKEWDAIPGARGCSPQACSFNDASGKLYAAGVKQLFGLSTQDSEYQREARGRLGLAYQLLSDENLEFTKKMSIPTFEWKGRQLTKRVTLAIDDGVVVKVWYPVFPSDRSAGDVLEWLKAGRQ